MRDLQANRISIPTNVLRVPQDSIVLGITVRLLVLCILAAAGIRISNQVFVATLICFSRSSDAKATVENEQERVTAEITAFERFMSRLEQLEITHKGHQGSPVNAQLHKQPQSSDVEIESVREHYRQTVMATDHYTEDYAESFSENIRIEFGPEYAAALNTNDYLTPTIKQGLLQATRETIRKRADFLSTLQSEHQSITDAQHRLDVDPTILHQDERQTLDSCSFDEILRIADQLQSLREESNAILEDRQQSVQNHPKSDSTTLQEYLYSEYSWDYPIILDTLDILTTIRSLEHQLSDKVAEYERTS